MNSTYSPFYIRRNAPRPSVDQAVRPELTWIHDGVRYRATVWPDVRFQRETPSGRWMSSSMSETVFASAALGVTATQWRRYLEFVPAVEREFLEAFQFTRMAALHVLVNCPTLLPVLADYPALTAFLTRHVSLCGGNAPRWSEIAAVFEREGIFGVLQWLGLPASRQTLAIFHNIADPDIPWRLLEPLRAALWEPEAIWALSHATTLTDERLAETCHALAA